MRGWVEQIKSCCAGRNLTSSEVLQFSVIARDKIPAALWLRAIVGTPAQADARNAA
jgi:hypothetical protein